MSWNKQRARACKGDCRWLMSLVYPCVSCPVLEEVRLARSAIARDLRTPKYRQRIVRSKKAYSRKGLKNVTQDS